MANNRALAIISFLVSSGAAVAMPPQDVPAEVKSCKAIADDKERLRCFDGLFGEPSKPQKTPEEESKRIGQSTKPNLPPMAVPRLSRQIL